MPGTLSRRPAFNCTQMAWVAGLGSTHAGLALVGGPMSVSDPAGKELAPAEPAQQRVKFPPDPCVAVPNLGAKRAEALQRNFTTVLQIFGWSV